MNYLYLTQAEQDDIVLQALVAREKEHFHYQLNIDNYNHILSEQLKHVPEKAALAPNLQGFVQITLAEMAASLSAEDFAAVSQVKYRDRVRQLLATEQAEQKKAETAYTALSAKLPAGAQRDAAAARATTPVTVKA